MIVFLERAETDFLNVSGEDLGFHAIPGKIHEDVDGQTTDETLVNFRRTCADCCGSSNVSRKKLFV